MTKSNDNVNQSGKDRKSDRKGERKDEVLDLVHSVMHQYRSQQYQVLRDGPYDITHMESKVLDFFGHRPGATQSDLSQWSGRDKAQLARLIKGLRDRELLAGEVGEADRRSVKLALTPEGQAVLRSLTQQARRLNAKAIVGLSGTEEKQLLSLLQRVKENLDSAD
ncbi:MAG: MarR family winged helix-turn-helix transcriptional regulator [Rhizobacter sp.]